MSLSERLRAAALERAEASGQHVDGIVLEPTGVIDLREMVRDADREVDNRVELPKLPEPVDERSWERPLAEQSLWRRLRPGRPDDTTPEPVIDLRDDEPTLELDAAAEPIEAVLRDLDFDVDLTAPVETPAPADPVFDEIVTAACDRCGSTGQRDLFDRFSRTEYFSCDDCGHMWQQRQD